MSAWTDYADGTVADVPQDSPGALFMTTLPRGMQMPVTVRFLDDTGQPADIDGIPEWASSDPSVLIVKPDGKDALTAMLGAIGPVNATAEWSCTGDADIGAGFEPVRLGDTIQVIGGRASTGDYTYGQPQPLEPEPVGSPAPAAASR